MRGNALNDIGLITKNYAFFGLLYLEIIYIYIYISVTSLRKMKEMEFFEGCVHAGCTVMFWTGNYGNQIFIGQYFADDGVK